MVMVFERFMQNTLFASFTFDVANWGGVARLRDGLRDGRGGGVARFRDGRGDGMVMMAE